MTSHKYYTRQQLSELLGLDCAEGLLSARPKKTLQDKCAELIKSTIGLRDDLMHLASQDAETQKFWLSLVLERSNYLRILKELLIFLGMSHREFCICFAEKVDCIVEATEALIRDLEELAKGERERANM